MIKKRINIKINKNKSIKRNIKNWHDQKEENYMHKIYNCQHCFFIKRQFIVEYNQIIKSTEEEVL